MHFSEAYCHSQHSLRAGRLHSAVEHVGQSILSGFVTSFGSSVCLIPCDILLLSNLGIIICITTFFSLLFAMGFFLPSLAIIGPQHNVGDLDYIYKQLRKRYRRANRKITAAVVNVKQAAAR